MNQPPPTCQRFGADVAGDAGQRRLRPCCSGRRRTASRPAGSGRPRRPRTGSRCARSPRSTPCPPHARCTPNTSRPRNFTNGFICNAVTLFLKPGLMSPDVVLRGLGRRGVLQHLVVARAGAVAAVERVAHRLVGLVHRAGQAHAQVLRSPGGRTPSLPMNDGPRWPGVSTVPRISPPVTAPIAMTLAGLQVDLAADLGGERVHDVVADERVVDRVAVVAAAEVRVAVVDLHVADAHRRDLASAPSAATKSIGDSSIWM